MLIAPHFPKMKMLLILKLRQSMVSAGNFVHLPLLTKIIFVIKQSDYKTPTGDWAMGAFT